MVGEVPIATPARHAFVARMTTHQHDMPRERRVRQDRRLKPPIERRATGVLPKIDASMRGEEWRPGESAKRGYEKAVEDWWWL